MRYLGIATSLFSSQYSLQVLSLSSQAWTINSRFLFWNLMLIYLFRISLQFVYSQCLSYDKVLVICDLIAYSAALFVLIDHVQRDSDLRTCNSYIKDSCVWFLYFIIVIYNSVFQIVSSSYLFLHSFLRKIIFFWTMFDLKFCMWMLSKLNGTSSQLISENLIKYICHTQRQTFTLFQCHLRLESFKYTLTNLK